MERYAVPMEINLLSKYYNRYRKAIREYSMGIGNYKKSEIKLYASIVKRLEYVAACLEENQRLIIVNEVFERRSNKWYMGYMSEATYYRHRKNAFETFVERLN